MVKDKVGGLAGCRCKTEDTTTTSRHPSHRTKQFTIDKLAVIKYNRKPGCIFSFPGNP